jgi:hypothetical protein
VIACVAAWLGIMAFFSFAVAPIAFALVERAAAGRGVAAILPRYYATGLGLCAVALVACVALTVSGRDGRARHLVAAALCALMLATLGWTAAVVTPAAEDARRARDDVRFARAHRASVQLNGLAMILALGVLVAEAISRPPRRAR